MSIWRSPSSRNWSIWFCNLWGRFLSDYTLLYIFGKLWRFRFFWWLFCSISMCIRRLMSVSRLSKFQAFISGCQSDFESYEVSSYRLPSSTPLWKTTMIMLHGSVAQFQHVLGEICVIEICQSSRHSFQESILFCNVWGQFLSNYHVLHIAGKIFWLCFFWWWSCQIPICIGIDMCIWRLPKFQTLILRHQTCLSGCELSACPIVLFWVFLRSYFEISFLGGCVSHSKCVLTKMCAFECCPSSLHWFQDNKLVLHFVRSVLIRWP